MWTLVPIATDLQWSLAAILNLKMIAPTDVKELQQMFIGLANYLGRFTPHLATVAGPLRDLCKTNIPCDWEPEHDAAFSNLKKAIPPQIRCFDTLTVQSKPLASQSDASQRGLGAALLQANDPNAFVSKLLSFADWNRKSLPEHWMRNAVHRVWTWAIPQIRL